VSATGWADQPACRAVIKLGITVDGHDQVYLALWVYMVRTRYVFHIDHID